MGYESRAECIEEEKNDLLYTGKNLGFSVLIYSLQSIEIISYILHNLIISVFFQRGFEYIVISWTNAYSEARDYSSTYWLPERGCTGSFRQLEFCPPES